ncbi:Cyclin-A1 [Lobulomyces angularis]|nr:Cyclin-A1 [Lobulomyces angularis]
MENLYVDNPAQPFPIHAEKYYLNLPQALTFEEYQKMNNEAHQQSLRESNFKYEAKISKDEIRDLDFLFNTWDNMKKKEIKVRETVIGNYLTYHKGINSHMRFTLIEWLCDVACEQNFQRQTFHLAVNYFDRYLSISTKQEVFSIEEDDGTGTKQLAIQFFGAACLLLAAKIEESNLDIPYENFVEFAWSESDNQDFPTETRESSVITLLRWEDRILHALDWELRMPTSLDWLMMYSQNCALLLPEVYGDNTGTKSRIIHRRFKKEVFRLATSKLDTIIANYESVKLPNSLIAAVIFSHSLSYDGIFDIGIEDLTYLVTGYKVDAIMTHLDSAIKLLYHDVSILLQEKKEEDSASLEFQPDNSEKQLNVLKGYDPSDVHEDQTIMFIEPKICWGAWDRDNTKVI